MNEKISKYLRPIKSFWGKLSKIVKTIILGSLAGVVILAIVLTTILNKTVYVDLYAEPLTQEEATQVFKALNETGFSFKTKNDSTSILIDEKDKSQILMTLATSGYPTKVPNFDFFLDNVDFMTTESEKRKIALFQMQLEMEAAIEAIEVIEDAIVIITPPMENAYAWEQEEYKPTASVQVGLTPGTTLSPEQVTGIKGIVAASNIGLNPAEVQVTDLATGEGFKSADDMNYVDINNFKLDIQNQISSELTNNIMKVLAPVYGEENISIAVNASYNVDKKVKEIISHDPSTEDGQGIIEKGEIEKETIKSGDVAGGIPGVEENADPPNYAGLTGDEENIYYKDHQSYEYAVNKITEQITSDAGTLEDLSVTFTLNQNSKTLTNEEQDVLIQAISNAGGVSPAKVTVLNTPYFQTESLGVDDAGEWYENKLVLYGVAGSALLLLVALILVILLGKRAKKKRLAAEALLLENDGAIVIPIADTPNMEEDMKNTPESREHALRKEIQDFSVKNPQIVAQLIKTWLRGETDE